MKQRITHWILILLLIFAEIAAANQPLFTTLPASRTGIRFSNQLVETEALNILNYEYYYNGGGVAAGDINNDGKVDLYFTANTGTNKLYLNKGDFQFQDITRFAGVEGAAGWKTGVTMVDINADGWLDIYVCHSGKLAAEYRKNELFINNKDLTFTEKAAEYGLDDNSCSTQAAFFDFDRDGDLDLYLLNHNIITFKNFDIREMRSKRDSVAGDKLFRNDNGKFIDISETAGIKGSAIGFGLGIAIGDINNDGWPDIYVANDYTEPDYLYYNNGDGTFTDKLPEQMGHISQFAMGCEMADFNNDGWKDIVTLDMLPEDNPRQKEMRGPANYDKYWLQVRYGYHHQVMRNTLQLNNQNGTFSEIGQLANISNTDWSWTPLLIDFDNDGWKDLYITNGYRRNYINMDFLKYTYEDAKAKARQQGEKANLMELVNQIPSIDIPNYFFLNNTDLTFTDASKENGITENSLSGGAVAVDLDNDGDQDLVVNNINQPAFIYRNEGRKDRHFLRLKFQGDGANTFGIGTKVDLRIGNQTQHQELQLAHGYQSCNDPSLLFGTGNATIIDEVTVTWPDQRKQTLKKISVDQTLKLLQQDAKTEKTTSLSPKSKLFIPADSLPYQHEENNYIDFKTEFLLPHKLSTFGPRISTADVNNDGLSDIFLGNAAGYKNGLLLQDRSGFNNMEQPMLAADSLQEDGESVFFDADKDGDLDLFIVSGGNEFESGSDELQDRLYLNDGKGNFSHATERLPRDTIAGLCAAAADIDRDGDIDLFVGGCVQHGQYGLPVRSSLLINDNGTFTDRTTAWCPFLTSGGMIMDATWSDLNGDQLPDLVIVGEWMSVRIFINDGNVLTENIVGGIPNSSGWWNCVAAADLDEDGDIDLIGGNRGINEQMKADTTHPAFLYVKDFDGNGTTDPIITYWIKDGTYPMASRDELLDQLLPLRKKYIYYKQYADETIDSIFTPAQLQGALKLTADEFRTCWFENDGDGHFTKHPFNNSAQFAPVNAILVDDFNNDKHLDILMAGNNYGLRAEMGRNDASFGMLLIGNGKGSFTNISSVESGLELRGECRDLQIVRLANGNKLIIAGINNNKPITYLLKK